METSRRITHHFWLEPVMFLPEVLLKDCLVSVVIFTLTTTLNAFVLLAKLANKVLQWGVKVKEKINLTS